MEDQTTKRSGDGDGTTADSHSPSGIARQAGTGESALVMSTWQSLLLAAVVAIAVWATVEAIMPVYQVPAHLTNFGNEGTEAQKLEGQELSALYRARNATISIALLTSVLALTLAGAELLLRGERLRAVWGGLLAGCVAAVIAIGAGAVGAALLDALRLPDHRLIKTMLVQGGTLGVAGLGIGLGLALALFHRRLVVTSVAGCLLGGLLAALCFPILASLLFPDVNTELVMPTAGIGTLLWLGLTALAIGATVTGLGKEKKKRD